ncbi:MAG: hypothetical protein EPO06_12015 [Burkholderiaceae bacterium]|nr:MAG: hypothetical protein EPO06_12015 [Burkholderiaceae bacterium]
MADWSYLVADLRSNVILDALELTGVKLTKRLSTADTFTATLPEVTGLSPRGNPADLTTPARLAYYALRDGSPFMGAVLWTSSYTSSSRSVSLGGAGWDSYFDHRYVLPLLPSSPTLDQIAALQTTFGPTTDLNEVARQLVALAQAHTGGNIGIQVDPANSGTARAMAYYGYSLTSVGDALRELSGMPGGPDFRFDVSPVLDSHGRPVRVLVLGSPTIEQDGAPHVFEYPGNVLDYTWPRDGTRMTDRAFATGEGSETGAVIAVAADSSKTADGWVLLESQQSYTTSPDLSAQAATDLHAGRGPVVLPTLTVRGDADPQLGTYAPGHTARVMITDDFWRRTIDTTMRIVQIDVDPSADVEAPVLTMAPVFDLT